ncbi:MAG TPA: DUF2066 domain-containing protein [Stellaceae bacterium]|jgi:hypothetical protein|nr:DUF2066 domain-containing protein [Stellaceae bacterium]
MKSPLLPAIIGGPIGRCAVGAAVLLVAMLLHTAPACSDDQQDPYTATVKVDATADNAADARRMARIEGQRRALDAVITRLSGSPDTSKLPKLDDNAVTNLVDSFEVAHEHMSSVRYLADYTFHFRAAKVRRLMRDAGIGRAEASAGKAVVVLPVYRDGGAAVLWDDPNPWREAWAKRPAGSGPVRIGVPLGGVADLSTIDAEQALSGDSAALATIAQSSGGNEAVVAVATPQRQGAQLTGLALTVKRYNLGRLADSESETIDAKPDESESGLIARAVNVLAAAIESGSGKLADANSSQAASLTATVPITSLGEWIEMRRRLAAVPAVRKIELLSLSRREAKIAITYQGTPDQLKSSLAEADLDLGGGAPSWQLQPAGAAGAR